MFNSHSVWVRHLFVLASLCGLMGVAREGRADLSSDTQSAYRSLQPVLPRAEALIVEGKVDEGNAVILGVFAEKSRTAVQAYLLANLLFKQDPKNSYMLHKRAATELPDEPNTWLEWAMEQHRAGEYAGALESYAKFTKSNTEFAPVYGLIAECLIRTGKTREAVDSWVRSEQATKGSLDDFESFVCDVNAHQFPSRKRADLLIKTQTGDINAAEQIIALDADFPRDWWNSGPKVDYLTNDLALVRRTKFNNQKRVAEILCAGDCALASEAEGNIGEVLRTAGFLLDAKGTLPESGVLLSSMLNFAFSSKVLSKAEARAKWGEAIVSGAKARKDAELFNVAANLNIGRNELAEIDRVGWEMTGDVRFAASLLMELESRGALKLDSPEFVRATKQFPENAIIAGLVVSHTAKEGKPLAPALINAIKAEYTHFSSNPISMRAGASTLRQYFAALAKELPPK